jgi:hypothetical protein
MITHRRETVETTDRGMFNGENGNFGVSPKMLRHDLDGS